jgi:hypothetical protein
MSARAAITAAAIVATVLLAVGAVTMWPVNGSGYQDRIVAMADGTLSAVRTVSILARADQDHRVTAPYVSSVMDSARDAVATSQHHLAQEEVPDQPAAALRDQLAPMLVHAAALFGDDDRAMASGPELDRLGDQLQSFVERHR